MAFRTAAENRAESVRKMGDELGVIYYELYNRHTWLLFKWAEYVELFGTSPERIGLLNESAPRLFRIVEGAMWADILLDLAKLTDDPSPRRGKRQTLTIRRVPNLVEPPIRQEVASAVETALASVVFARDWRNRTLAHLDLALATKRGAKALKPASRAAVKAALKAIGRVLDVLETYYLKVEVYRRERKGDSALGLLHRLHEIDEVRKARSVRIKAGKATPEDVAYLRNRRSL